MVCPLCLSADLLTVSATTTTPELVTCNCAVCYTSFAVELRPEVSARMAAGRPDDRVARARPHRQGRRTHGSATTTTVH
jgi:hypothetical protein